ncbi:MAG: S46 family peptidase, partial [Cyclobacteriaceae bacterium]|nr:S46 family peptidase [Cyclobacteriaceae bacterium]
MKNAQRFLLVIFLSVRLVAFADEGMWLPLLLAKLNEKEMRGMGMKITADDIYSVSKSSLKDAIVSFGGFCTGEVISSQGLVLTNHHCGFGAIQSHTTLQDNYIDNGFWAMRKSEELSNPSLFVTFIVRIEDVTAAALRGVTASMSERERQAQIDQNINAL